MPPLRNRDASAKALPELWQLSAQFEEKQMEDSPDERCRNIFGHIGFYHTADRAGGSVTCEHCGTLYF